MDMVAKKSETGTVVHLMVEDAMEIFQQEQSSAISGLDVANTAPSLTVKVVPQSGGAVIMLIGAPMRQ
jgi:hypothetical protein